MTPANESPPTAKRFDERLKGMVALLFLLALADLGLRVIGLDAPATRSESRPASAAFVAQRPPKSWSELAGQLGMNAQVTDTPEETEIDETAQQGALDLLVIDRARYQLRACFLEAGRQAAAAVSMASPGDGPGLRILYLGDKLGPYEVMEIGQTSLRLLAPGNREVVLRLFPLQAERTRTT